jgi:radical SAM protein with 4Fe4S-binding SPASM domain
MSELHFVRHHFTEPSSHIEQQQLFSASVSNVVIEITSYCNRKCNYCPVSKFDRTSIDKILPEDMFIKIIQDLQCISYAQGICLNLYNEPTADSVLLLERIRHARHCLPESSIYFSTNGDYLTPDYVKAMVDAGLSLMYVTLHPPANASYDDAHAVTRFCELSKRLGKTVEVDQVSPGHTIQGDVTLFGLPIHVFSTNYQQYGSDRAGSVNLLNRQTERSAPCNRPFNDFTVSYDGTIFPCCQMFADETQHRENFAIGNLRDFPNIFAAYASTAMAQWRQHLLRFSPKKRPCDTCTENNRAGTDEEHRERDRIYRQFVGAIEDQRKSQNGTGLFRWFT